MINGNRFLNFIIHIPPITAKNENHIPNTTDIVELKYLKAPKNNFISIRKLSNQKIIDRYQKNTKTLINHPFQKSFKPFIKALSIKLFIKSKDSIFLTRDSE